MRFNATKSSGQRRRLVLAIAIAGVGVANTTARTLTFVWINSERRTIDFTVTDL